jgi:hypothetical protein
MREADPNSVSTTLLQQVGQRFELHVTFAIEFRVVQDLVEASCLPLEVDF